MRSFKQYLIMALIGVCCGVVTLSAAVQDKVYRVGFGDSGVGGLIFAMDSYEQLLPYMLQIESKYHVKFELHHIGDTKNAPYGSKDPKEISRLTQDFVGFLANDAKSDQIVIACNTASTIVDNTLEKKFQQLYPNQPITEIIYKSAETVYKQAKVVSDKSGQKQLHIAVLATPATIASGRYQKALDDIHSLNHGKKGVTLHTYFYAPKTWVANIEHGATDSVKKQDLEKDLQAFLNQPGAQKSSAVGLFCTHYPYFKKQIHSYLTENGVSKSVVILSQGKIFATKIREKIDAEIKQGLITKRAKSLPVRHLKHPMIYSHITGDNIAEVKKVAEIISPKISKNIVYSQVKIKPIAK